MHRRTVIRAGAATLALATQPLIALRAAAHHGWSSFDETRPLYLSGRVRTARWQNPHAELFVEVAADLKLPPDLAARPLPRQQQQVDGAALMRKVTLPPSPAGEWELELAPLNRMTAWDMATPLAGGDTVEVVGYAPAGAERKLMRVEYLFARGRVVALRSAPAPG